MNQKKHSDKKKIHFDAKKAFVDVGQIGGKTVVYIVELQKLPNLVA